jgi:hypothetical protein
VDEILETTIVWVDFGDRRTHFSDNFYTTSSRCRGTSMAAYQTHLRKIHDNEVLYGGSKPLPTPYTTDRDILDTQHKFLRDDTSEIADPLVKEYYESLIKDCVLVDLSKYKEKQVCLLYGVQSLMMTGCHAVADDRGGESWEGG